MPGPLSSTVKWTRSASCSEADRDLAALGRKFHRIAHEGCEDALNRQRIRLNSHLGTVPGP